MAHNRPRACAGWLSAHLYFDVTGDDLYGAGCDTVVREVVRPFVARCVTEGWITGYFFVRYRLDGPHVRLRLCGADGVLAGDVAPALAAYVGAPVPRPDATGEEAAAAPGGPPAASAVTRINWIPYEPETARYGGPDALAISEGVFRASSDLAFEILQGLDGQVRASRLGKALLAMVVLAHAIVDAPTHAIAFMEHYHRTYLHVLAAGTVPLDQWRDAFESGYVRQAERLGGYVRETWRRLDAGERVGASLDDYHGAMRTARKSLQELAAAGRVRTAAGPAADWRTAAAHLLPSYTHMMNNRLGVSIPEESYLAHLISRALTKHPMD